MVKKLIFKNEKAFTLIEMMIVLLVITIILLIAIPNVTKHSKSINNKGCEALVQMVQAQVQAYYMDHNVYPVKLADLEGDYLKNTDETKCPNGKELEIVNGVVSYKD